MGIKIVCTNKKAYHDYFIEETIEAGISLLGAEVKSLRQGRGTLKDCYALIKDGEAFLLGLHISPYSHSRSENYDPTRTRKLLLHNKEISRLYGKIKEKSFALLALKIYFTRGRAKVELGLARGKKQYDKRETLKKRSDDREMERAMKGRK